MHPCERLQCQSIGATDDDIHTLPEDDLTIADLWRYRWLDKNCRSVTELTGVEQHADGGGREL